MRRQWRMQRGAFEDTAKTAGWQARGFYCRDGAERRSAACGGCSEALSRIRQKQRADRPAVFAVTVEKRRCAACGGTAEAACFPPQAMIYSTRRCTTAGGWSHPPKGGEAMRITLHIGPFTVTIIVKSRNRHSAK